MNEPDPHSRQVNGAKPRATGRRGRPSKSLIEKRDQQLLDHALNLFLDNGFAGTTIEAISESIAMSPRTIYARYRDKDELFRAVLERAIKEWIVPATDLVAAGHADFDTSLITIAHMLVAKQTSPSGLRLTRIANAEAFRKPEIGAYLWEQTALPAIEFLAGLFRTRLVERELNAAQAHAAAQTFMILVVNGAFQSLAWNPLSPDDLHHLTETRTRLFIAGARAIYGECAKDSGACH